MRPGWDDYFLGIAKAVAARADCTRAEHGAVIVRGHTIIATGYNGAPGGAPGCLGGACPRGRHWLVQLAERVECGCGGRWPCPDAVPSGSSYDTGPGACISIHAEANAIIRADYEKMQDSQMYVTGEPCGGCWKLIKGAGIMEVFWPDGYWINPQSK